MIAPSVGVQPNPKVPKMEGHTNGSTNTLSTTTTTTTTMVDSLSTIVRKKKAMADTPSSISNNIKRLTPPSAESMDRGKAALDVKELISLGHFNKALLDSDELDYVTNFTREKYLEEEELLPDQIKHYLQHLCERGKESTRLKRFSTELEYLTTPLDENTAGAEALFTELLKMTPDGDGDMLDFERIELRLEELRRKTQKSSADKRLPAHSMMTDLCDFCVKKERGRAKVETAETSCQTDFSKRLNLTNLGNNADATARLMEFHAQQQQIQQLQQQHLQQFAKATNQQLQQQQNLIDNSKALAAPVDKPMATLPSRQRKKATAKKVAGQQHPLLQQHADMQRAQQLAMGTQMNLGVGGQNTVDGVKAPSSFVMPSIVPSMVPPNDLLPLDAKAYLQASGLNVNSFTGLSSDMVAKGVRLLLARLDIGLVMDFA